MCFLEKFTEPFPRSSRSRGHFRGRGGQILEFHLFFNEFSFRIFVVFSFEVIWPWRPRRPQKGLREFFQKLHFWNQCVLRKKMRYVTASWSKFSLNLSTEEVWYQVHKNLCGLLRLHALYSHNVSSKIPCTYNQCLIQNRKLTDRQNLNEIKKLNPSLAFMGLYMKAFSNESKIDDNK